MEINKEKPWFNFKNMGSGKAALNIFGVIGWDVWLQQFSSELKNLDVNEIEVLIASEGGHVTDGIAIFNMLKMHKAKIVTNIISHAWSIASIIALAGDERKMAGNASYMIHNPWNIVWGEAEDLRKQADILDMVKETLVSSYREVTDLSREEISNMMDEETWLLAEEAKDYGFITEVTGVSEQAAAYVSGPEDSLIQNSKAKFSALNKKKPEGKKRMNQQEDNNSAAPAAQNAPAAAVPPADQNAPAAPTATASLDLASAELIEVPGLDLLSDERARASKITEICNQAGAPEKAADFINKGHSVDKAKAELFDSLSNESLRNGIQDSSSTNAPEDANPLLTNMQARYPEK